MSAYGSLKADRNIESHFFISPRARFILIEEGGSETNHPNGRKMVNQQMVMAKETHLDVFSD